MPTNISRAELFAGIPLERRCTSSDVKTVTKNYGDDIFAVVLDDDPTGTQSVSALPVLTSWRPEDFSWAMQTGARAVYVMTNSRSLDEESDREITEAIVHAAYQARREIKDPRSLVFISRSDSTLRGHFPLEPDVISLAINSEDAQVDGYVLVPAFPDAGRFTINSIHYTGSHAQGYVPVSESEFAKDATFGYRSSFLPDWVAEKSSNRYRSADVVRVTLQMIREQTDELYQVFCNAPSGTIFVCDTVSEADLRVISCALIQAESKGKRFVYRVGPPFVRARLGQDVKAPLTAEELSDLSHNQLAVKTSTAHGLIVVGSHVGMTSRQLAHLQSHINATTIELDVAQVIADENDEYLPSIVQKVVTQLEESTVILATSRNLVTGVDADDSLRIARAVSQALVDIVYQAVSLRRPQFVIAKGGITSSDVASKGLRITKAQVIGPMLPGIVSLWQSHDGIAPGVPYVVFPGNVGDDTSLTEVTKKLLESRKS